MFGYFFRFSRFFAQKRAFRRPVVTVSAQRHCDCAETIRRFHWKRRPNTVKSQSDCSEMAIALFCLVIVPIPPIGGGGGRHGGKDGVDGKNGSYESNGKNGSYGSILKFRTSG